MAQQSRWQLGYLARRSLMPRAIMFYTGIPYAFLSPREGMSCAEGRSMYDSQPTMVHVWHKCVGAWATVPTYPPEKKQTVPGSETGMRQRYNACSLAQHVVEPEA